MYNHYIPQSDGSYRRSSIPDRRQHRPQQPAPRPEPEPKPEHKPVPRPDPRPEPPKCDPHPEPRSGPATCDSSGEGLFSFLKGLLPRQIDTADLMILFLLLLMNKDAEDGLSPMLTLALYFLL